MESRALSMLMRLAQEAATAKAAVEDALPAAADANVGKESRALGIDGKGGGGWLQEQLRAKGVDDMVASLLLRRRGAGLGSGAVGGGSGASEAQEEEVAGCALARGRLQVQHHTRVRHFGFGDAADGSGEASEDAKTSESHQLLKAAMIAAFLAGEAADGRARVTLAEVSDNSSEGAPNEHARQLALRGPPLSWCAKVLALLQQRLAQLAQEDEGVTSHTVGDSDGSKTASFDSTVFELGTLLLAVRCCLARHATCDAADGGNDAASTDPKDRDLRRPWTARLLLRSMALCSDGHGERRSSRQCERDTCLLHATAALLHLVGASSCADGVRSGGARAHDFLADPRSGARALLEQLRLFATPQRVRVDAAHLLWELGPEPNNAAAEGQSRSPTPHLPRLHTSGVGSDAAEGRGGDAGTASRVQTVLFCCCAAACVDDGNSDGLLRARRRLVAQVRATGVHVVFGGGAGNPLDDPAVLSSAASAADAVIVEFSAAAAADVRCRLLAEHVALSWDAGVGGSRRPTMLAHLQVCVVDSY